MFHCLLSPGLAIDHTGWRSLPRLFLNANPWRPIPPDQGKTLLHFPCHPQGLVAQDIIQLQAAPTCAYAGLRALRDLNRWTNRYWYSWSLFSYFLWKDKYAARGKPFLHSMYIPGKNILQYTHFQIHTNTKNSCLLHFQTLYRSHKRNFYNRNT